MLSLSCSSFNGQWYSSFSAEVTTKIMITYLKDENCSTETWVRIPRQGKLQFRTDLLISAIGSCRDIWNHDLRLIDEESGSVADPRPSVWVKRRTSGHQACHTIAKLEKERSISQNTHHRGSITVQMTSCLTCLDATKQIKLMLIQQKQSGSIQTKYTGGQQYRDTSP